MRSAPAEQPRFDVFTPEGGTLSVATCTGAAGTYGYHIDVRGGGAYLLGRTADPVFTFDTPPNCDSGGIFFVFVPTTPSSWLPGAKAKVTIKQTKQPPNQQVDSIQVYINKPFDVVRFRNYVTFELSFNDNAIAFFNDGHTAQGCGATYWRTHPSQWALSNRTTTTLLGTLFDKSSKYSVNGKALSAYAMLEALSFNGNASSATGTAQALLRAATAAELNSRRPQFGYPIPSADLAKSVNYALNSGNRGHMLTLAVVLEILNNWRCPLN